MLHRYTWPMAMHTKPSQNEYSLAGDAVDVANTFLSSMKACELKHSTVNSTSQHTSKVVRQWGSRTPRAVHHIPSSSIASVPGETTRRSWVVIKKGSIDNLQLRTEPLPAPSIGQATVEVKAIGLNFADVFSVLGLYSATPRGEFVPGLEFSGTVTALGPSKQTGEQLGATPPLQVGTIAIACSMVMTHTCAIVQARAMLPACCGIAMHTIACMSPMPWCLCARWSLCMQGMRLWV